MARRVAAPAVVTSPVDYARAAGIGVALLLAALIGWPVAALLGHGLRTPLASWPWSIAIRSLVVALSSACVAFGSALLVALALARTDVPGRSLLWRLFRIGALMPPFMAPLGLLVLAGLVVVRASWLGLTAIVVGQSVVFLPYAVALVVRTLAPVAVELEQAAELLGASRSTIMRRVTLGLAGPGLARAALVVVGLCLADVATPMLLGGNARVLATVIVDAATAGGPDGGGAALLLAALAVLAALPAGAWEFAGVARTQPTLPRLERPTPPTLRWGLGSVAWIIAAALATLWLSVPLASVLGAGASQRGLSLAPWATVAAPPTIEALRNSLLLGLGVALAGTLLALVTSRLVEVDTGSWGRATALLVRVPAAIPGVAAGVGYVLVFGPQPLGLALALVAIVVCWELPVTWRVARDVLVRTDRASVDAAIGLGAGRGTALTRILAPALRPVSGWLFAHLFAAGVLAVGTVVAVVGAGHQLGALTVLTLAAAGATGAACAVATALLALAGGAVLLGRAIAGRQRGPTLLA